ncbi:hypothetical protein [Phenylobacterium sp.]|uniref:hypothetical protein n=1 Tax=Phenylobacterium sp. TaxID=1871053 RepID=UPI003D29346D
MARILSDVPPPRSTGALTTGSPLSLETWAALQAAPRKTVPQGTMVTVRSYNIPRKNGAPRMPRIVEDAYPEHMYVELDDGHEQLIARGGPKTSAGAALSDEWTVSGGVGPARDSRDYGKGERVVQRGFLPDVGAQRAAEVARRLAADLARDPRRYGANANSNSYAADVTEALTGQRPGDGRTWGSGQRLKSAHRVRSEPLDISPAMRGSPY